MIEIDGSRGEGGGQILRTTLSLAMCLGKKVRINNIRAGRSRPGLLRQHLACLRAAKEISDAKVTGDELGSSEITFAPGEVKAGEYRFAIGSAGSTTLVFQTVLMPLLFTHSVSEVRLEGGTHNGMAPSFDFIAQCFLPVLSRMGCKVEVELKEYAFYPSGGGSWHARIYPLKAASVLSLLERGEELEHLAVATSANIVAQVNQRELAHVQKKCLWPENSLKPRHVRSVGPGNILSLRVTTDVLTEVFESVGEKNVSSERVAGRAIHEMKRYLRAGVPVGKHLADQLVLPMVLGSGGSFRTLEPSLHLQTNIDLIRLLAGAVIRTVELGKDDWEISVAPVAL